MALRELLLVDDSEAILAYERAALGDRFMVSTARDGIEALARLRSGRVPDLVVLDLSMPHMDGEELLGHIRGDSALRDIPVLVVSTEAKRARVLVDRKLVEGFLVKPIDAASLRATVERLLEEERWRRSRMGLTILRVRVGPYELAFPLASVVTVIAQPMATRIAGAPAYLRELVDVHGQPIAVLDLAQRLAVTPSVAYIDRSLVVLASRAGPDAPALRIAIAVDEVADPEVVPAEDVLPADGIGGATHAPLDGLLLSVVRLRPSANAHGSAAERSAAVHAERSAAVLVPVLRAEAFLSRGLLAELAEALAATAAP